MESILDHNRIDYTLHQLVSRVGCEYISDLRTQKYRRQAISWLELSNCSQPEKKYIENYIRTDINKQCID